MHRLSMAKAKQETGASETVRELIEYLDTNLTIISVCGCWLFYDILPSYPILKLQVLT